MLGVVSKFVLEVLPWALASLIVAFLLAGHLTAQPVRAEVKPVPAGPVLMAAVVSESR
jgi:hypothetical protein